MKRLVAACAAALLVAAAPPARSQPPSGTDLRTPLTSHRPSASGQRPSAGDQRTSDLAEARRLIQAGDAAQAVSLLEPRIRNAGDAPDPQTALLLGLAYYQAGQPARAVQVLTPVVDQLAPDSPDRRDADRVLGLAAFVTGRFADAVPRLEATAARAEDNAELSYALGQAYIHTGKPDAARRVLGRLYGVAEGSAAARVIAAQVMIRLEMNDLAEAELRAAVAQDARTPHANFLLGQIALFRGRLDEAVSRSRQELDVNPASAVAFSQLGDAYVRQAKWDDAIAALQKSVWLNPYYSAPYILLGRAYMKKEQPSIAEGMLRRAIEYDPNNRAAHYLLGQLLQQTGRPEDAQREFDIAERLPGNRGG
jgi:tetratricopeptide (TPR) repeat protein